MVQIHLFAPKNTETDHDTDADANHKCFFLHTHYHSLLVRLDSNYSLNGEVQKISGNVLDVFGN